MKTIKVACVILMFLIIYAPCAWFFTIWLPAEFYTVPKLIVAILIQANVFYLFVLQAEKFIKWFNSKLK